MARKNATLGLGLSLLASIGVASYMSGRRAVPPLAGTLRLDGLTDTVDVVRDRYGVPAVFARNESDLFFVQGHLHASDRMFQMDLLRRIAYGRVAEVVGEAGLASDRLNRVLGFGRQVEEEVGLLSYTTRAALDSFAAGVNQYLASARRRMPVEFRLLGYRPEPWKPAHSLIASRLMALGLCGNWESELARAEIAHRFGADVLAALDDDADARAGFAAQIGTDVLGELAAAARDATSVFGGTGGIGSNNWVIGPRRTRDHGALLANDPHLDLQLPSAWYEQVLRSDTFNVRGFALPGVPGIIIGHNGRIGWGFTNSCADVQDLYLEQVDAEGRTYRDTDGKQHPLESRTERIKVKGGATVELVVRSTRRGPILTDAVSSTVDQPMSLRWDALRPGRALDATLGLCRADGWDAFRAAISQFPVPSQNAVYADTSGNIGYQLSGEIPIRAGSNGTMPMRGDDPAGEWTGTIPFEELPWAFNPSSDRIVTANDKLVDDSYPHFISTEWMNGYRGERIRERIDAEDGHTVERQVDIQRDVYSTSGRQLVSAVLALHPKAGTPEAQEVLDALHGWDFELAIDSDGGIAYRLLLRAIQEQLFGFLDDMRPRFLGYSRLGANGHWSLFGRTTPRIIRDMAGNDTELLELGRRVSGEAQASSHGAWRPFASWQELVEAALVQAGRAYSGHDDGDAKQGDPMSLPRASSRSATARFSPRRRRYHRLRLQHPLGSVPGLAAVANYGPFPVPGDLETVWQASSFNNPKNDHAMVGPSHRQVLDMANLDGSVAVLAGGQSGHPASPHYIDQVNLWRQGKVRPAPWTREAIERIAAYHQTFEPSGR